MPYTFRQSVNMKSRFHEFFFLSVIISLFLWISPLVFGVETNREQTASPSSTPVYIQYDLAYPGILPDHPLIKLKVLRDKLIPLFIQDTSKKIEFYLHQADKGILAAAMLVDKGKIDLAGQTALKAEHNMTVITPYLPWVDLKKDPSLLPKLKTASGKHQEVLLSLIPRVPKKIQDVLLTVVEFSKKNEKMIYDSLSN